MSEERKEMTRKQLLAHMELWLAWKQGNWSEVNRISDLLKELRAWLLADKLKNEEQTTCG